MQKIDWKALTAGIIGLFITQYIAGRFVMNENISCARAAMKTSARNLIEGTIKQVKTSEVAAVLKVEIDTPRVITSLITEESRARALPSWFPLPRSPY